MLDEGVDVPDANLGIVMSASRTRRQMIQRMGRILRRKQPGVAARFVIMFAKDTVEDPTSRIERDGFLDEIERISEATGVFDGEQSEALDAFLAAPGPELVREPERAPAIDDFDALVIQPEADAPYLEVELPDLPQISKPMVKPKQLSTGQAPLEIAAWAPRGGSAAPGAASRHRRSSSGGRPSSRAWSAAASDPAAGQPTAFAASSGSRPSSRGWVGRRPRSARHTSNMATEPVSHAAPRT